MQPFRSFKCLELARKAIDEKLKTLDRRTNESEIWSEKSWRIKTGTKENMGGGSFLNVSKHKR